MKRIPVLLVMSFLGLVALLWHQASQINRWEKAAATAVKTIGHQKGNNVNLNSDRIHDPSKFLEMIRSK